MLRTLIVLLRFYIRLQRYNNKARIAKKKLRVENIRSCQGLGELETLGQLGKLGILGELEKLGKTRNPRIPSSPIPPSSP